MRVLLLLMLSGGLVGHAQVGQTPAPSAACAPDRAFPDADLYCIELLPAVDIDRGSGTARLVQPSSPFGISVSPSGHTRYTVVFTLRDLPNPDSLGPYTTFVAWATPPQLRPVTKLGVVTDGTSRLGVVDYDRFLILITAERSAAATEPSGRMVLRGTSASVRMQPHDIGFLLGALIEQKDAPPGAEPHAGHDLHAPASPGGWTPPPMHAEVSMPPAFMTLRPDVSSYLPRAADDTPLARPRELVRLKDGEQLALVAGPVRRVLFGRTITMLGFNGQYPGPLIEVDEGSTIIVQFTNRTDFPTAVHWHGLRLDNRFDGAPHVTQDPVAPGASFEYRVFFRDAGIYWYHPHHREDVLQDLGLYGNLLVRSRDPGFFAPANREEILMLDDLLVADGHLVEYGLEAPTHALMGRFGNALLVNGEPQWQSRVRRGEIVRLFLTNVSSTRVFNLSFEGAARMKLVASDLGRYEREAWVDNVTIAPAERYIVDVRFPEAGEVSLVNRVRAIDHMMARFFEERHVLGVVTVSPERASPDHRTTFDVLRTNEAVTADIDRYRAQFTRPVDRELVVTLETTDLPFPLRPLLNLESVYRHPVEWAGTMPEMDWIVSGRNARWILRDGTTRRENMDIDWRFRLGEVVKIRLVNDRNALHAMQHPIHIHGQRFLVLSVNGVPNDNLVWKDTVLLPTGFVADVLLEISNPGKWMLHCHVAEHIEAGMRMVFEVEP
ncbi:MAG TPA: multicopper oxidase family protein [Vicinamibacterales bacterium]|nr:multicopper oxidase family protein [Vicinamibacterales bacterium]